MKNKSIRSRENGVHFVIPQLHSGARGPRAAYPFLAVHHRNIAVLGRTLGASDYRHGDYQAQFHFRGTPLAFQHGDFI